MRQQAPVHHSQQQVCCEDQGNDGIGHVQVAAPEGGAVGAGAAILQAQGWVVAVVQAGLLHHQVQAGQHQEEASDQAPQGAAQHIPRQPARRVPVGQAQQRPLAGLCLRPARSPSCIEPKHCQQGSQGRVGLHCLGVHGAGRHARGAVDVGPHAPVQLLPLLPEAVHPGGPEGLGVLGVILQVDVVGGDAVGQGGELPLLLLLQGHCCCAAGCALGLGGQVWREGDQGRGGSVGDVSEELDRGARGDGSVHGSSSRQQRLLRVRRGAASWPGVHPGQPSAGPAGGCPPAGGGGGGLCASCNGSGGNHCASPRQPGGGAMGSLLCLLLLLL